MTWTSGLFFSLLFLQKKMRETKEKKDGTNTIMPPMQIYLNQLQAKAQSCLRIGGRAASIWEQCEMIRKKLRKHRVDAALNWIRLGSKKAQRHSLSWRILHTLWHRWKKMTIIWINREFTEPYTAKEKSRLNKVFVENRQTSWDRYQKKHEGYPHVAQ